ncbi:zinc-dependent alcohol dehydrogenase [Modestobacter excelsi]|uniref:zinc-dependent alcohol dehydrogenase n=1 Tax=Modestobacter excelsi TaxID=2213161 RepID=UPI00110D0085|nr:zinc-binding dehydrogenase [Modestobacter excelsi]
MASQAQALVQRGPFRAEIEDLPIPALAPGAALVRVEANGLCATDIDAYAGEDPSARARLGDRRFPRIPGHEIVGIVEDLGPRTLKRKDLEIGTRVAVNPMIACGVCEFCQRGQTTLCRGFEFFPCYGTIPLWHEHGLWGGYSTYVYVHPNATLYPFPHEVSALDATLWNTLSAGVQWAVMTGGVSLGTTVLVLGSGQRGLANVVASRSVGAGLVITTGLTADRHKLDLALELGADAVIDVESESTVDRVLELTGGRGVDVVVDTTPHATAPISDALDVLRPGGRIVLAGIKSRLMDGFPVDKLVTRGVTMIGATSQSTDANAAAAKLVAAAAVPLHKMRTHVVGYDELPYAIDLLTNKVPGEKAINVVVTPTIGGGH